MRTTLHPRHLSMLGYVYFIGVEGEDSPVKIGWASRPETRLSDLQVSHWRELKILGRVRAAGAMEASIHRALAAHHVRGEWFERAPALAMCEWLVATQSPHLRLAGSDLVVDPEPTPLGRAI